MHNYASLSIVLLQLLWVALVTKGRCISCWFAPCNEPNAWLKWQVLTYIAVQALWLCELCLQR